MPWSRTLSLYVAREILLYSALAFTAILVVLLSETLLERLDDLLAVGLTRGDLARVLRAMSTLVVPYAVPIAFGYGALLAIGRLDSDSEVLAIRSCGAGPGTLLLPAVGLGLVASALTGVLLIFYEPGARLAIRTTFVDVAARGAVLEAGRFRGVGERMVYVEERDRSNGLRGVVISDRTNPARPYVVFAEEGRLEYDDAQAALTLHLERGQIHFDRQAMPASQKERNAKDYRRISFGRFDYVVPSSALVHWKAGRRKPEELSLAEIDEQLARLSRGEDVPGMRSGDPVDYQLEVQRRYALSLAPLFFSMIAVPLGLVRGRGSPAWSVLTATAMTLAYYALIVFGRYAALEAWVSPVVAYWLPNALFVAGAIWGLRRAERGAR